MIEPDDPLVCDCRYDNARDEMDREDCPFHRDLIDEADAAEVRSVERKRPLAIIGKQSEDAA